MNEIFDKDNIVNSQLRLWYTQPAQSWQEALPLGNGRIGAMIYGNPHKEVIDLSEITCFSGESSSENDTEGASEYFYKARKALLNEDYKSSKQYINKFIGKRLNYGTNLPLGHLVIESAQSVEGFTDYARSLHLDTALSTVAYSINSNKFCYSAFISNPYQVMVIKIQSQRAGKLDLLISLDGGDNPYKVEIDENNDFLLYGKAYESIHSDGKTGASFHGRMRIIAEKAEVSIKDGKLHTSNSEELLILLALGTDFDGMDMVKNCKSQIDKASHLSYDELLKVHIEDHKALFNRVELTLGENTYEKIPTDLLLQQIKNGIENQYLTGLLFQYGRYLLIASSRENSPLPAHLQGVWNDSVASRIGWTCDMHLDINTQMNYWPSETTNLSQCNKPLFRWIEEKLVPFGRLTAQKSYGLNGWVAELVSNAWGFTAPYWHYNLSPCPTSGVWIATHLWEHYLFTGNVDFLKECAYPIIKESAEFFIDYIFEDPKSGYLTSGPSISPENIFIVNREEFSASIGTVYEIVMIREIFNNFLEASKVLEFNNSLTDRVKSAVDRLQPFEIGPKGELKEWSHNYASKDPQHRHTSHLLSLFPFNQITPEKTPELAEAAKTCIKLRMNPEEGWEDTGWARSMMMLYSARLLEREKTYSNILAMEQYLANNNLMIKHPPTRGAPSFADVYELDGNTGLTTCIAEMLLQSHNDELHLLPVLPKEWSEGSVKGLCARGGFEVNIEWKNGVLLNAVIYSKFYTTCTVRYGNFIKSFKTEANSKYLVNDNLEICTQ
jgi:alpha-L-fucosidase 2